MIHAIHGHRLSGGKVKCLVCAGRLVCVSVRICVSQCNRKSYNMVRAKQAKRSRGDTPYRGGWHTLPRGKSIPLSRISQEVNHNPLTRLFSVLFTPSPLRSRTPRHPVLRPPYALHTPDFGQKPGTISLAAPRTGLCGAGGTAAGAPSNAPGCAGSPAPLGRGPCTARTAHRPTSPTMHGEERMFRGMVAWCSLDSKLEGATHVCMTVWKATTVRSWNRWVAHQPYRLLVFEQQATLPLTFSRYFLASAGPGLWKCAFRRFSAFSKGSPGFDEHIVMRRWEKYLVQRQVQHHRTSHEESSCFCLTFGGRKKKKRPA